MTSPATGATGAPDFPEYVPVPAIAKGADLNKHGYHVWQVERNLYAVTDRECPQMPQNGRSSGHAQ